MSAPATTVAACLAPLGIVVVLVLAAALHEPLSWWQWMLAVAFVGTVSALCSELLEEVCSKHDDPIY